MKKKNGLLQTFFYNFLKIQVTIWVREILVTFENQSSIIYWFLLRYTVIIYEFTQGNLGAKKIASSRFQSPVKKKNCDIGDRQHHSCSLINFFSTMFICLAHLVYSTMWPVVISVSVMVSVIPWDHLLQKLKK